MFIQAINLGIAPDYEMRSGRRAVYHAALMEVRDGHEAMQRFTFSHLSFFVLVNEIAERSVALGIRDALEIRWDKDNGIGLEFISSHGIIKVDYRIHPGLDADATAQLKTEFTKKLGKRLGILQK